MIFGRRKRHDIIDFIPSLVVAASVVFSFSNLSTQVSYQSAEIAEVKTDIRVVKNDLIEFRASGDRYTASDAERDFQNVNRRLNSLEGKIS